MLIERKAQDYVSEAVTRPSGRLAFVKYFLARAACSRSLPATLCTKRSIIINCGVWQWAANSLSAHRQHQKALTLGKILITPLGPLSVTSVTYRHESPLLDFYILQEPIGFFIRPIGNQRDLSNKNATTKGCRSIIYIQDNLYWLIHMYVMG